MDFGKVYTVTGTMKKRHSSTGCSGDDIHKTTWECVPFDKPVEMLYIGYRYVKEGVLYLAKHWEYGQYEDFMPSNQIRAYLFVGSEHTNPVYVHPEQVINQEAS